MEWSWSSFFWGALGAAAPEILRLYNIFTGRNPGEPPRFGLGYFLISVFFVSLGGAVAVAWGEHHPFKSFWVGLSLPVIISELAAQFPTGRPKS